MTVISIIVAMNRDRVIGKDGVLPWDIPQDMERFREITTGHPVIMGRKTYESIGKALPGRTNIVLSRRKETYAPGCVVVKSVYSALWLAGMSEGGDGEGGEVFVIGGGEVYQAFLAQARRLYLTEIHAEVQGDVLFPEVDWDEWALVSTEPGATGGEGTIPHRFKLYERVA